MFYLFFAAILAAAPLPGRARWFYTENTLCIQQSSFVTLHSLGPPWSLRPTLAVRLPPKTNWQFTIMSLRKLQSAPTFARTRFPGLRFRGLRGAACRYAVLATGIAATAGTNKMENDSKVNTLANGTLHSNGGFASMPFARMPSWHRGPSMSRHP